MGYVSVTNHLGPLGENGVMVVIRFFASKKEGARGGGRWGSGVGWVGPASWSHSTVRQGPARLGALVGDQGSLPDWS